LPRRAREVSQSGIYHVMARGISRERIFLDDADRRVYLNLMKRVKDEDGLLIFAFCLMDTHVHLLLRCGVVPLANSMKRLNVAYAVGFNKKYDRNGYLFQGRFRSEPVDNDDYFLTVFRYIHQNPVKASICSSCGSYRWSSYHAYANARAPLGLVDKEFPLELAGGRERLLKFTNTPNEDACLDVSISASDAEVRERLEQLLRSYGGASLSDLSVSTRNRLLCELKRMKGASIRQIARISGLSKSVVEKA
jgi:putative transposase